MNVGDNKIQEARAMAQQLRVLAAVEEDLGSGPRAHVAAHNYLEVQFQGDLIPSSGFCGIVVHIQSDKTPTDIK